MLTKQEIFNKVWNHFVVNHGAKSMMTDYDGDLQCAYRGKDKGGNPTVCALGLFLEDAEYDPEMEGKGLECLVEMGPLPSSFCTRMDMDRNQGFLVSLQRAHDESSDDRDGGLSSIEGNLRRLAKNYSLDIPRDERMSY